jgi:hypothetical protein
MRLHAIITLFAFQLFTLGSALAQVTGQPDAPTPGVTATPTLATGQGYWLWVIVALVAVAMAVWVYARRRRG